MDEHTAECLRRGYGVDYGCTCIWRQGSGWCPSCTCGWHKAIDAFDVTPPEGTCRNPQCQCHRTFWESTEDPYVVTYDFDTFQDELGDGRRYQHGDR